MVDAPEAWEYPKPGTEDEIAAARAAQSEDAPRASTDPGTASATGDKAAPRTIWQHFMEGASLACNDMPKHRRKTQ